MKNLGLTDADIRDMFGDFGNFADYWLNIYGPPDHKGWRSADDFLKEMQKRETATWSPDDETIEALMKNEFTAGGGLTGATQELLDIRAALVRDGKRALEWERKLGRLART